LVLTERKIKRHKVHFEVEIDEKIEVKCDEVQIGQVFTNLVSNAIDANSKSDQPWVKVTAKLEDKMAKVMIQDSGLGIDQQVVNKIFNPFFTTKPVQKGTGLGLSLSKGLVESNGGKIWYEPIDGHTAFVVVLPVHQADTLSPSHEQTQKRAS